MLSFFSDTNSNEIAMGEIRMGEMTMATIQAPSGNNKSASNAATTKGAREKTSDIDEQKDELHNCCWPRDHIADNSRFFCVYVIPIFTLLLSVYYIIPAQILLDVWNNGYKNQESLLDDECQDHSYFIYGYTVESSGFSGSGTRGGTYTWDRPFPNMIAVGASCIICCGLILASNTVLYWLCVGKREDDAAVYIWCMSFLLYVGIAIANSINAYTINGWYRESVENVEKYCKDDSHLYQSVESVNKWFYYNEVFIANVVVVSTLCLWCAVGICVGTKK